MSTFIRSAIFAAAVLGGLASVQARDYNLDDNGRAVSSYDLNNPADVRSFWDKQSQGGN